MNYKWVILLFGMLSPAVVHGQWSMHIIDNTSYGADGTRLGDVNQDSLTDIVTGWEQGKSARLYINPGRVDAQWSYVEVPAPDVEDAFIADLDGDGMHDIVTLSEGETQQIALHWAPTDPTKYLDFDAWKSVTLPASNGRKWMFGQPMQVDGKHGMDLVVGSKRKGGTLGWMEAPENPRQTNQWKYHEIIPAEWIMSIEIMDMDGDGREDIVVSDRYGDNQGVKWLKHPGYNQKLYQHWQEQLIGLDAGHPMFLNIADINDDNRPDIFVPDMTEGMVLFKQYGDLSWKREDSHYPEFSGKRGKAVAVGDLNNDGQLDLASTYEQAYEEKSGVIWISAFLSDNPKSHSVSGTTGNKFDLVRLIDMDGDGDLDILTSEENDNSSTEAGLGVVWYENPVISAE